MRIELIALALLTASLVGCGGPPKPDWVQTLVSAAEQAEAECPQSYEVREGQKNSWCAGMMCFQERPADKALKACMALKGFKKN